MNEEFIEHTVFLIARELQSNLPTNVPKVRLLIETKFILDRMFAHYIGAMIEAGTKEGGDAT